MENKLNIVKEIDGEWFMYLDESNVCPFCEEESEDEKWINIDKAVKYIQEYTKRRK